MWCCIFGTLILPLFPGLCEDVLEKRQCNCGQAKGIWRTFRDKNKKEKKTQIWRGQGEKERGVREVSWRCWRDSRAGQFISLAKLRRLLSVVPCVDMKERTSQCDCHWRPCCNSRLSLDDEKGVVEDYTRTFTTWWFQEDIERRSSAGQQLHLKAEELDELTANSRSSFWDLPAENIQFIAPLG